MDTLALGCIYTRARGAVDIALPIDQRVASALAVAVYTQDGGFDDLAGVEVVRV